MATKSKATAAIAAGVLSAALLLGGTLAWYSEEQSAENRAIVDINPGGRLHDDFDGSNKDVYVENFGDKDTGVPIYARIRLDEYMEYGQDAGTNLDGANRKVKVLDQNPNDDNTPNIKDESTWETYIPGEASVEHDYKNNPTVYSEYWGWDLGQSDENKLPYYLPTFNKNKDSKAADINGTYAGENGIPYGDYKIYNSTSAPVTDTAVYDWDTDTKEEFLDKDPVYDNGGETQDDATPIDSADVLLKEEPHPIQRISSTSEVILMSDYLKMSVEDRKELKAWVYDADGWAYWSQAIQPGETTGLLLDGIEMDKVPDDNWYYGINVVGQFATMGDLSAFENEGDDFSPEAREMMSFVAGQEDKVSISGKNTIKPGTSNEYSAIVTRLEMPLEGATLTWSIGSVEVDGAALGEIPAADYSIDASSGMLTVSEAAEAGAVVTVVATTDSRAEGKMKVHVMDGVLEVNWDNDLRFPLAVGETAVYKLIFTPDEDGDLGDAVQPEDMRVKEVYCLTKEDGDDGYLLVEGEDYTYDPETQVFTLTQVEGGCDLRIEGPDGGGYDIEFLPIDKQEATLIEIQEGVYKAELTLPHDPSAYYGFSFVDEERETVVVKDLALSGYYYNGTSFDEESDLLLMGYYYGSVIYLTGALEDGSFVYVELQVEPSDEDDPLVKRSVALANIGGTSLARVGNFALGSEYTILDENGNSYLLGGMNISSTEEADGISLPGVTYSKEGEVIVSECKLCIPRYYYGEETITLDVQYGERQITLLHVTPVDPVSSVEVTFTGDFVKVTAGESFQFGVNVDAALGVDTSVTWSVVNASDGSPVEGVSINEDGLLTTVDTLPNLTMEVKATSCADETVSSDAVQAVILPNQD